MYGDDLLTSPDPAVSYRAHRRLAGVPEDDPEQQRRRGLVASSENVTRMLSGRRADGTIGYGDVRRERELVAAGRAAGAYRKWQGPHWTLAGLAELGYPPGDASLRPVVDQVLDWLLAPRHLTPPSTQVFPGQEDRVRRCASMEGLALWYLHELGLADDRADQLASRLVGWQWPDGGWNCDKPLGAHVVGAGDPAAAARSRAPRPGRTWDCGSQRGGRSRRRVPAGTPAAVAVPRRGTDPPLVGA